MKYEKTPFDEQLKQGGIFALIISVPLFLLTGPISLGLSVLGILMLAIGYEANHD